MVGIARILRCDKFGNVLKAYRTPCHSVGSICWTSRNRSRGSWRWIVRRSIPARWRKYTLYVWSGIKDPVKGALIEVRVSPASAAGAILPNFAEGAHDDQVYFFQQQFWYHSERWSDQCARGRFAHHQNARTRPIWQCYCLEGMANARSSRVWTERCAIRGVHSEIYFLGRRKPNPRPIPIDVLESWKLCRVGHGGWQAVVGWPRVIHVSPNVTDADQSKMRLEAETLALMSELVTSNQRGNRMLLGAPVRDRGAFGQRTVAAPGRTDDG